jgi:hypothetical protein
MTTRLPAIRWEVGLGELATTLAAVVGLIYFFAIRDGNQTLLSSQVSEVKTQVQTLDTKIEGLKQTFGPFAVLVNDVATLKTQWPRRKRTSTTPTCWLAASQRMSRTSKPRPAPRSYRGAGDPPSRPAAARRLRRARGVCRPRAPDNPG